MGCKGSYREVMEGVERLKAVEVKVDGKRYLVRTELEGKAYEGFRALRMRVPGRVLEAGEGKVLWNAGQCVWKPLIQEDFFVRGIKVGFISLKMIL